MARKPKALPVAKKPTPVVTTEKRKNMPPRKQKGMYSIDIDLAKVERLRAIQCTDEELAAVFGVTKQTIENRKKDPAFLEAYTRGTGMGRASLKRRLWRAAKAGNVTAQIWLSKQYLGMRDVTATELSGPNGGPIETNAQGDLKNATVEELLAMKQIWQSIRNRNAGKPTTA
jgi:hypothetical protein